MIVDDNGKPMTLREVFVEYRSRKNLQHCDSPAETEYFDRHENDDPKIYGATQLAAAMLLGTRRSV
jgi:hypothetical protein